MRGGGGPVHPGYDDCSTDPVMGNLRRGTSARLRGRLVVDPMKKEIDAGQRKVRDDVVGERERDEPALGEHTGR